MTVLCGVRVLDLADESGVFATRLLADLGADVIRVEPPGGGRVRSRQPFLDGRPGVERSLVHLHHNAGKRSITLDFTRPAGADLLRRLVSSADILVDTATPGSWDPLGLGHATLCEIRPSLIHASITPFGQSGPWSQRKTSDLVAAAAAGLLFVSGDPADPPTQAGADASYKMASLVALAGCLIALSGRDRPAEGRDGPSNPGGVHLDVSVHEAVAMTLVQTANPNHYVWNGVVPGRPGLSGAVQCADGHFVTMNVTADRFPRFIRWVKELGIDSDLGEGDFRRATGPAGRRFAGGRGLLRRVVGSYDREEFLREAWARDMHALPIQSFDDLASCEHFRITEQFLRIRHDPLEADLGLPRSALAAVSDTGVRGRAPLLGEHNPGVYADIGLESGDLDRLAREGVI